MHMEFETHRTISPVRVEDVYHEQYKKRMEVLENEIGQLKARYEKEISELKMDIEKLKGSVNQNSNAANIREVVHEEKRILRKFKESLRYQLEIVHETNYTEVKGADFARGFMVKSYKEPESYNQIRVYRPLENKDCSKQKFGFHVAVRSNENRTYSIQCIDTYHTDGSNWKNRQLIFSVEEVDDTVYYIRKNDEQCMELHKSVTPFPVGITFYDSFITVLDKIGLKKNEYIETSNLSLKPNTSIQIVTNPYTCILEFCKKKNLDVLYKITILIQK